jgi:S1-C subfamily serine protease
MKLCFYLRFLCALVAFTTLCTTNRVQAQAADVKIISDSDYDSKAMIKKANTLRKAGGLLSSVEASNQLNRASCELKLPKPATKKLGDREIWQRSQAAHVRVGWLYLCKKCSRWHQNLAGGYFITADGVIATCFHVVNPFENFREAYLIASTEDGRVFPVTEILAANNATDCAIIRAKVDGPTIKPLAVNSNVYPGDSAWCYSDPEGRNGYFSKGMVNRFYYHYIKDLDADSARMEVSTDWAPGSSGSAVLDVCGNAIGHVSEIAAISCARNNICNSEADECGNAIGRISENSFLRCAQASTNELKGGASPVATNQKEEVPEPVLVFHCAARAADVLALVKPPKK